MAIKKVWNEELQDWIYDDPDVDTEDVEKRWESMKAKPSDVDFSKMKVLDASPSVLEAMRHAKKDK